MIKKIGLPKLLCALAVIIVVLIEGCVIPNIDSFYKNMEYLNIYSNGSGLNYGAMANTPLSVPLSFNHLLINILRKFSIAGSFSGIPLMALYYAFLAFAIIYSCKNLKRFRFLAICLCGLFLFNKSYIAYFNTLLPNGTIIATFVLTFSLFVKAHVDREIGPISLIFITLFTFAFSFNNITTASAGIIFGLLIFRLLPICKNNVTKIMAVAMAVIVIISNILFAFNNKDIDYAKKVYSGVFNGISKYDSVEVVGIDKNMNKYKETYYSDKNVDNSFYDKVNYYAISKYYLTHPASFVKQLNNVSKNLFFSSVETKRNIIGKIKNLLPGSILFIFVLMLVYLIIVIKLMADKKYNNGLLEIVIGLIIMSFVSFIVPGTLFGISDINLNLVLFNLIFDILIIIAIYGGTIVLTDRKQNLRDKYGVTQ